MFAFWVVTSGRFDCISIYIDVFSFRKAGYECFFFVDSSKRYGRGAFRIPLIFEHEKVSFRRRISADRVPALIKVHSHLYFIVSALSMQSKLTPADFIQKVFIFSKETLVFHPTAPKQLFLYNTTLNSHQLLWSFI